MSEPGTRDLHTSVFRICVCSSFSGMAWYAQMIVLYNYYYYTIYAKFITKKYDTLYRFFLFLEATHPSREFYRGSRLM